MPEPRNGQAFAPTTPPLAPSGTDPGVLAIGLAYLLWYRGVQLIGNSRTAAYSNLTPVVALAVAWVWLGEVPRLLQLGGAAVVLVGLTLARLGGEQRSRTPGASTSRS